MIHMFQEMVAIVMNFSIWSTPSIAQFFTGNNLCKERIGKLFFIMCLDCPTDLSGLNII